MSFQVGRISFDRDPRQMQVTENGINLTFDIIGSSVTDAQYKAAGLIGLGNNRDEPVVPVDFGHDGKYTGYYHVDSVSLSPDTRYLATGLMRATINLVRLPQNWRRPRIEIDRVYATRSTAVHSPTLSGFVFIPEPVYSSFGASKTIKERIIYDSPITGVANTLLVGQTVTSSGFPGAYDLGFVDEYYNGACTFEHSPDGTTYYSVAGRDPIRNNYWRIQNNLIRIEPFDVKAYIALSTPEYWLKIYGWVETTNAWAAIGILKVTDGTNTLQVKGAPRITRNTPEEVSLLIQVTENDDGVLGLSMKRGDRFVTLCTEGISGTNSTFQINDTAEPPVPLASTALTGGFRQTTGVTHYQALASAQEVTASRALASGQMTVTTNKPVMWACAPTGTAQESINEWWRIIQTIQRVSIS